jgi:CRP/FNR family transcriptional regulator, cyclic AMP receptor protein
MVNGRSISLLDVEPDLGRLLDERRSDEARAQLVVRQHVVESGTWEGERLRDAGPDNVGLFIIDGLVTRELALADNVSAELLGPGDLIRPWQAEGPERLVPFAVRWTVLRDTRLAVLDRRFGAALVQYPEVNAMLIDRMTERTRRLSVMQAISQLNGVDRRLLTLFWHLAERWGRVTPEGVAVAMDIPHRVIAQLVGARRPTVSTALSRLGARGELVRRPDGIWLLTGAPFGMPSEEAARIVRQRRLRRQHAAPRAGPHSVADLHDVLASLRDDSARRRAEFQALRGEASDLMDRLASRREEREQAARRD